MMMRFKEAPEGACTPGQREQDHACVHQDRRRTVMLSDGRAEGKTKFEGFALSVDAKDEAEAERMFAALGKGGQVQMPLAETFFAKRFGMVADKFGVGWMIVAGPKSP